MAVDPATLALITTAIGFATGKAKEKEARSIFAAKAGVEAERTSLSPFLKEGTGRLPTAPSPFQARMAGVLAAHGVVAKNPSLFQSEKTKEEIKKEIEAEKELKELEEAFESPPEQSLFGGNLAGPATIFALASGTPGPAAAEGGATGGSTTFSGGADRGRFPMTFEESQRLGV